MLRYLNSLSTVKVNSIATREFSVSAKYIGAPFPSLPCIGGLCEAKTTAIWVVLNAKSWANLGRKLDNTTPNRHLVNECCGLRMTFRIWGWKFGSNDRFGRPFINEKSALIFPLVCFSLLLAYALQFVLFQNRENVMSVQILLYSDLCSSILLRLDFR